MAVKKGNLDQFLNVGSPYSDNQKNLRSIFIDKNEDDLKQEPQNFLEASVVKTKVTIPEAPNHVLIPDTGKPGTNREQTGNKLAENPLTQNDDILITGDKPGTNKEQSGNKAGTESGTNREQIGNEKYNPINKLGTNKEQSRHKTGNSSGNKVETNREQTGNSSGINTPFNELTGLQREIIIFMSEKCKQTRSKSTDSLTLEYLESALKHNKDVIKTSIKRLEKKGCIIRIKFKNGRGGWSQYQIPEDIYHEAIQFEIWNKSGTNWEQIGNKLGAKPGTELGTIASSSSSNNLIETTTTELSAEWNFDITSYTRFGFTMTHIKQLASLNSVSAVDVEQSLIEFSYDLDNNSLPQIKTNKINFLMGLLRGGNSYVSENYRSLQDQTIKMMAERAAQKRKLQVEEKFIVWESQLSEEERQRIISTMSPNLMVLNNTHGIEHADVKNWFLDYYLRKCSM